MYRKYYEEIIRFLLTGDCWPGATDLQKKTLQKKASKYKVLDGVLYHKGKGRDVTDLRLVPITTADQRNAIRVSHENSQGIHFGVNKTASLLADKFYWRMMFTDVANFCQKCELCSASAEPPEVPPLTAQIESQKNNAWKLVEVDFLENFHSTRKTAFHVLRIVDVYSNWMTFIPLTDLTEKSLVRGLVRELAAVGFPLSLRFLNLPGTPGSFLKILHDELVSFSLVHGLTRDSGSFSVHVTMEEQDQELAVDAYLLRYQEIIEKHFASLYLFFGMTAVASKSVKSWGLERLKTFCNEYPYTWTVKLPYLLFSIQNSVPPPMEKSPFEIFTSGGQRTGGLFNPHLDDEEALKIRIEPEKILAESLISLDAPQKTKKKVVQSKVVKVAKKKNDVISPKAKKDRKNNRAKTDSEEEPLLNAVENRILEELFPEDERGKPKDERGKPKDDKKKTKKGSELTPKVDLKKKPRKNAPVPLTSPTFITPPVPSSVEASPSSGRYSFRQNLKAKGPSSFVHRFIAISTSKRGNSFRESESDSEASPKRTCAAAPLSSPLEALNSALYGLHPLAPVLPEPVQATSSAILLRKALSELTSKALQEELPSREDAANLSGDIEDNSAELNPLFIDQACEQVIEEMSADSVAVEKDALVEVAGTSSLEDISLMDTSNLPLEADATALEEISVCTSLEAASSRMEEDCGLSKFEEAAIVEALTDTTGDFDISSNLLCSATQNDSPSFLKNSAPQKEALSDSIVSKNEEVSEVFKVLKVVENMESEKPIENIEQNSSVVQESEGIENSSMETADDAIGDAPASFLSSNFCSDIEKKEDDSVEQSFIEQSFEEQSLEEQSLEDSKTATDSEIPNEHLSEISCTNSKEDFEEVCVEAGKLNDTKISSLVVSETPLKDFEKFSPEVTPAEDEGLVNLPLKILVRDPTPVESEVVAPDRKLRSPSEITQAELHLSPKSELSNCNQVEIAAKAESLDLIEKLLEREKDICPKNLEIDSKTLVVLFPEAEEKPEQAQKLLNSPREKTSDSDSPHSRQLAKSAQVAECSVNLVRETTTIVLKEPLTQTPFQKDSNKSICGDPCEVSLKNCQVVADVVDKVLIETSKLCSKDTYLIGSGSQLFEIIAPSVETPPSICSNINTKSDAEYAAEFGLKNLKVEVSFLPIELVRTASLRSISVRRVLRDNVQVFYYQNVKLLETKAPDSHLKSTISAADLLPMSQRTQKTKEEKTLKCPICPKTYVPSQEMLDLHLKFHCDSDVRNLLCPACRKPGTNWRSLLRHYSTHPEGRNLLSSIDPQFFASTNKAQCSICGKLFKSKELVGIHVRTKHRHQPAAMLPGLSLQDVGMEASRLVVINKEKQHSNNFKCPNCEYSTDTHYNFIMHTTLMECQNGIPIDKPSNGLEVFGSDDLLFLEEEEEEEDMKYICQYCPLRFNSSSALEAHLSRHDSFFFCKICPYKCKYKNVMVRHAKNNHGDIPIKQVVQYPKKGNHAEWRGRKNTRILEDIVVQSSRETRRTRKPSLLQAKEAEPKQMETETNENSTQEEDEKDEDEIVEDGIPTATVVVHTDENGELMVCNEDESNEVILMDGGLNEEELTALDPADGLAALLLPTETVSQEVVFLSVQGQEVKVIQDLES